MKVNVEYHSFRFTGEAEVSLVLLVIDKTNTYVDTDSYLGLIQSLDEQLYDYTESQVNSLASELVATAHTAIRDPGAATPPDEWDMSHALIQS